MKMTLKNKNLIKIKKLFKEAEKLEYVPYTIEVSNDEIKEIINELCFFKNKHYTVVYKDRRRDNEEEGISSSITSACLQHRPNEIVDMLIAKTAKLVYRESIDFVVMNDSKPEVLMETTQEETSVDGAEK